MFVDRQEELAFLDRLAERRRPTAGQLLLLYGRRRIGKTSLLLHWSERSGLPTTYWTAEREPAALQRRKLFAALLGRSLGATPVFAAWSELWSAVGEVLGEARRVLVLDELPYAMEADSAMLSALQHAWDHNLRACELVLVLCGSQVRTMELIQGAQSPLFGRLTGQWHLQELPFSALRAFFPAWSIEERIAAHAVVGGIPAYLEWLDPELGLSDNIRREVLAAGSLFSAEPTLILYDAVRDPMVHLAILRAIGAGAHTLDEIATATLVSKSHLSAYLVRLQELRMVERRLPATVPPAQRLRSRRGRYHLADPYFRFYFRFMAPAHELPGVSPDQTWQAIQGELRAFVGQTAFEDLCRRWILEQGHARRLPFAPEIVGSHWSRQVQTDVVAVSWREKAVLIGECKWGAEPVDRRTVRDLLERTGPRTIADLPDGGAGWQATYALFARAGFTPTAAAALDAVGALAIDAGRLDADLA